MIKKKYPAKKPELKKFLNCKSLSGSNLQVTIFRISISIFKGRPKGKIRPTFLFWQAYSVFSYWARTNSISFTFIPHKSYRDLIGEIK